MSSALKNYTERLIEAYKIGPPNVHPALFTMPFVSQIVKLQEEVGEVAQAYVLNQGWNPRKKELFKGDFDDVRKELLDVIVTASVAITAAEYDLDYEIETRVQELNWRLDDDGA